MASANSPAPRVGETTRSTSTKATDVRANNILAAKAREKNVGSRTHRTQILEGRHFSRKPPQVTAATTLTSCTPFQSHHHPHVVAAVGRLRDPPRPSRHRPFAGPNFTHPPPQGVADAVRTSLGPRGMDKMIQVRARWGRGAGPSPIASPTPTNTPTPPTPTSVLLW